MKSYPAKDHSELLAKLSAGVEALVESDKWREYLDFQAKLPNYSPSNTFLLWLQGANRVASYNAWKKLGRNVKKGAKAVYIYAPIMGRKEDKEGEEVSCPVGFRLIPVFDASATEGDELPEIASKLTGLDEQELYPALVQAIEKRGWRVEQTSLSDGINGQCTPSKKLIEIHAENDPLMQVKTLVHEFAHSILHADTAESRDEARSVKELEAESTAYLVLARLGIESDDYSFGYLAEWGGGKDVAKKITAVAKRILQAANQIYDSLEATTI